LIVTEVPTGPIAGVKPEMVGLGTATVNVPLLVAACAPTVTLILPVVAPLGTVATIWVVLAELTDPAVPLNFTTSFAAVALKFVPVIVTVAPTFPLVGVKLVIVGAGTVTLKLVLLVVVWLATVTLIAPVVAPAGTATTSCVAVAEDTVAAVPLNMTTSLVFVVLKLVPLIVTDVPTAPDAGEKLAMVGRRVTLKLLALVAVAPPTVTVIGPLVAPLGTPTTS
jgi:hypothetical protein